MTADTFAKLVLLDALAEAEVGYHLEQSEPSPERFREGFVARVSDLVDEIDALDVVAAARVYDAIVEFLAALPGEGEGALVEAAVRFRGEIDRIVQLGLAPRERRHAPTWAAVLDELLAAIAREHRLSAAGDSPEAEKARFRVRALYSRALEAAGRALDSGGGAADPLLRDQVNRLGFVLLHLPTPPAEVERRLLAVRRRLERHRPTTLTRVGGYVLRQVLRRGGGARTRSTRAAPHPRSERET